MVLWQSPWWNPSRSGYTMLSYAMPCHAIQYFPLAELKRQFHLLVPPHSSPPPVWKKTVSMEIHMRKLLLFCTCMTRHCLMYINASGIPQWYIMHYYVYTLVAVVFQMTKCLRPALVDRREPTLGLQRSYGIYSL